MKHTLIRSVACAMLTTALALAGAEAAPTTQPLDPAAAALSAMSSRLADFDGRGQRLEEALARLAEVGNVSLDVKWDDLAAAGISKDAPLDSQMTNVSLRGALRIALTEATPPTKADQPELRPQIEVLDNGQVLITTTARLYERFTSERRYDLADLMTRFTDANIRERFIDGIEKTLCRVVAPETWTGKTGTAIKHDDHTIIAVQTDENHRAIQAYVEQLRAACLRPAVARDEENPAITAARVAMKADVGKLRLRGESLEDAVKALHTASRLNIFVNWDALSYERVTRQLPVTVDLSNLPFDQALNRLLEEVSGTQARLAYSMNRGVVEITTARDLSMNGNTRVYDVRLAIGNDATRADDVANLIRRVQGIDPLSWKDAGGKIGSVRELAGQLIITQTPEVHQRIQAELKDVLRGND